MFEVERLGLIKTYVLLYQEERGQTINFFVKKKR